jgi:formylmethanofuran dehydrogenase subunit E
MSEVFDGAALERTIAFHGHTCPGLAIGIRAAELAVKTLGTAPEAELVAVVETDMCGVDAIQVLTGCTFGKGNLIHRDHGKMAFSFFDRKTGKGFRALVRPETQEAIGAEARRLMKKVSRGEASDAECRRLDEVRRQAQERTLSAALEELFSVQPITGGPPRPARVLDSLRCERCGEMTMESRTRRFDGETLCIPCFERSEQKT